jgi:4'-phosphopantetheinyl transferase
VPARESEEAASVSDSDYPGNEAGAPRPLPSPAPGVALWWCPLVADDETVRELTNWLSAEERARVARFGKPILARRYTVGRAALRFVLAARLDVAPYAVPIERDPRGRPRLPDGPSLDFNVTHTGDAAMFGLVEARGVRIGVDLERASRNVNDVGLARRVCTSREREALATLDVDTRRLAFLRLWTCKEAMSKATGDALAAPFRHLDVACEPGLALVAGPPPYAPRDWTLHAVEVPDELIGTVALWSTDPAQS